MRTLRAIMWLRWRLLMGSLRGGQRRDSMEMVSRALAAVIPIAFIALSFGSVVAVCLLGFLGGRAIGTGLVEPPLMVVIVRLTMVVMLALVVVITVASPVQTAVSRYRRLLLLPISRHTLHLVEVMANLADPWIGFLVPGLVAFSLGLAVGGKPGPAFVVLVASLAMMAVLASLGALIGFVVSWLFRNRRRGEVFTLVFVLSISFLALIPATLSKDLDARKRAPRTTAATDVFKVEEFDAKLPRWSKLVPSEIYGRAILASVDHRTGTAWLLVLALALEAGVIFVASGAMHRYLLTALEGDSRRRHSRSAHLLPGRLPFVNAAVSAIAIAQFRNAMRSIRGRLIVLLPGPMIAIMTLLFRGMPDEYRWASTLAAQGHLVLAAGSVFAVYAMQAFTMNLFGSDRAGLSMYFLAPVDDADLALGKVFGAALVLEVAVVVALVASLAVAPSGSPFYWLATIAGAIATFLVLSPFAIWLSALFPVASDLSKTGAGGNPHPFPMLVGMILTLVAAAPAGLILAADQLWIHRPGVAFLFMLVWTFMAAAIAMPLVGLASRTIGARRENLALVAAGR